MKRYFRKKIIFFFQEFLILKYFYWFQTIFMHHPILTHCIGFCFEKLFFYLNVVLLVMHLHWKKPFKNIIFIDQLGILRGLVFPSARNPVSLFCVFCYWTNDRARRGVKIVCCRQYTTFDANRLFNCVCASTTPHATIPPIMEPQHNTAPMAVPATAPLLIGQHHSMHEPPSYSGWPSQREPRHGLLKHSPRMVRNAPHDNEQYGSTDVSSLCVATLQQNYVWRMSSSNPSNNQDTNFYDSAAVNIGCEADSDFCTMFASADDSSSASTIISNEKDIYPFFFFFLCETYRRYPMYCQKKSQKLFSNRKFSKPQKTTKHKKIKQ